MVDNQEKNRAVFESAIRALEVEIANIGVHITLDSTARQAYAKQIQSMSTELKMMCQLGKLAGHRPQSKQMKLEISL